MKEGYWLHATTGVFSEIDEHARWISTPVNAARIGLAPDLALRLALLDWKRDRLPILLSAMGAGLIRVRGHGSSITFEFTIDRAAALEAIQRFLLATDVAGPLTVLRLHDLRHQVGLVCTLGDLVERPGSLAEAFQPVALNYPQDEVERALAGSERGDYRP